MDVASFERRVDDIWAPGSIENSSLDEIERQTAAAFGLDQAALTALMDDAWSEYVGTLNQEVADYFVRLRTDYKTGILSNSFVGAREREQAAHRFGDMCDVIVYSHEEGYLKPELGSTASCAIGSAWLPKRRSSLDDVQQNVDGARAAGMNAITFIDNRQGIAELHALLIG